jgi:hypothetical protein
MAVATSAAALKASCTACCVSVRRLPSALSSRQYIWPARTAIMSGTPATTPRTFSIAASIGRRARPLAGWKASTPAAGRARKWSKTARWIAASGCCRLTVRDSSLRYLHPVPRHSLSSYWTLPSDMPWRHPTYGVAARPILQPGWIAFPIESTLPMLCIVTCAGIARKKL